MASTAPLHRHALRERGDRLLSLLVFVGKVLENAGEQIQGAAAALEKAGQ